MASKKAGCVWDQIAEPGTVPALITQLWPCRFRAGQVIFAQGDPGERVFAIKFGIVVVSIPGAAGRENLLATFGPTDIFGELAVLDPAPRTCTARAITDVEAVWLDRATVRAWMVEQPHIAERLLQLLARRLQDTEHKLVEMIWHDVAGRVAQQLLSLARLFGEQDGDVVRVEHGLTQNDVSQLVGSSRETVNKVLADFTQRGWILTGRKSVLIFDSAALARRAGVNPSPAQLGTLPTTDCPGAPMPRKPVMANHNSPARELPDPTPNQRRPSRTAPTNPRRNAVRMSRGRLTERSA